MLVSLLSLSNIAENNMARQIRKKSGTSIYHVMLRMHTGTDPVCTWTETWANYLSKNYFGIYWLGNPIDYPVKDISIYNKLRITMAKFF